MKTLKASILILVMVFITGCKQPEKTEFQLGYEAGLFDGETKCSNEWTEYLENEYKKPLNTILSDINQSMLDMALKLSEND